MEKRATEEAGERLELCNEGMDGWRYYLSGEGIRAGDLLEMQAHSGAWTVVRFEWNYCPDTKPTLFTREGTTFALPDQVRFRWPQR
jgi:hypothetical protein